MELCNNGHDLSIRGRYESGRCRQCQSDTYKRRRKKQQQDPKPPIFDGPDHYYPNREYSSRIQQYWEWLTATDEYINRNSQ